MNALTNIQLEAQVIVERVADRQINEMKERYNEYQEWIQIANNPIMKGYYEDDSINEYESIFKYIYMTKFKRYNHELKQSVLSTVYPTDRQLLRAMMCNGEMMDQVRELHEQTRANWDVRYREQFISKNSFKLNRALAKHLTNNMTASNIKVLVGDDGAEVTAIVDNMVFRTFGTLCGGYIQCYHYRYRSSLK
jgi:hypothetical protein